MILLQITDQITSTISSQSQNIFNWVDKVKEMSLEYAPKIIGALVIYILGRWLIKWVSKITRSILNKKSLDSSLQSFFTSTTSVGLNILLFITIISVLGVETTSFAAILAGVGLGIGAAMNGSLGNIAGGVMILILKPFKIGDIIETGDYFGIVQEIGIVSTTILTSSNKTVYLPNGMLSTEVITNLSAQKDLRVDITIPVSEETDIEFARKVAVEAMLKHPDIIKNPAPMVTVGEIDDDAIILNLFPRIESKPYDAHNPRELERAYYSVYFGVLELVKTAFQNHNIEGPSESIEIASRN